MIFLFSCSSAPKKNIGPNPIDKEFAWVENNDFIPEKEIPFVPYEDIFEGSESKYDTLSTESIERLPKTRLEDIIDADNPLSSAIAYCHNGNFDKGFMAIDALYQKYKSHPSYWNTIGSCYFQKQDKRKALLYYNKALSINSSYAPSVNNIGVLYWRNGKYQKALLTFQKAMRSGKFSLTPSFNLASLYLKFGLIKKAEKLFKNLYKRNARDLDVINSLATIYMIEGKVNKSIRYFEILDDEYHELPHSGLNFAMALKLVGRKSEAKSVFRDIKIENYPQYTQYASKIEQFIGL